MNSVIHAIFYYTILTFNCSTVTLLYRTHHPHVSLVKQVTTEGHLHNTTYNIVRAIGTRVNSAGLEKTEECRLSV